MVAKPEHKLYRYDDDLKIYLLSNLEITFSFLHQIKNINKMLLKGL